MVVAFYSGDSSSIPAIFTLNEFIKKLKTLTHSRPQLYHIKYNVKYSSVYVPTCLLLTYDKEVGLMFSVTLFNRILKMHSSKCFCFVANKTLVKFAKNCFQIG